MRCEKPEFLRVSRASADVRLHAKQTPALREASSRRGERGAYRSGSESLRTSSSLDGLKPERGMRERARAATAPSAALLA
jgi:hypothetical protein